MFTHTSTDPTSRMKKSARLEKGTYVWSRSWCRVADARRVGWLVRKAAAAAEVAEREQEERDEEGDDEEDVHEQDGENGDGKSRKGGLRRKRTTKKVCRRFLLARASLVTGF